MTRKLKPAIKRKWLKALRSGEYAQGRGQLCRKANEWDNENDKFCCLGVLVNEVEGFSYANRESHGYPTPSFRKRVGLDLHDCKILACLNDGEPTTHLGKEINPRRQKWGFKRIANWIEKNL